MINDYLSSSIYFPRERLLQIAPPFNPNEFQITGEIAVVAFLAAILLSIGIMIGLLVLGWWVVKRQGSVSPYTGKPMHLGEDIARSAIREIEDLLHRLDPIDNPPFDMRFAAICPQTGRIFPDCVNRFGVIRLNWNFLQKRYSGKWVSWGSLNLIQQAEVRSAHDSLEGFQTDVSCTSPFPKDIDRFHAMAKPGPLYVDLATKNLMGWKCVPGTTLEVLVVQRPYYQ